MIAGFVAEAEAAPDELTTIANVMAAPPLPFVPEELHGRPVVMAMMVYAGDVDAGQRAVAPFRALAEPIADLVRPMKYPEMYPDEEAHRPVARGAHDVRRQRRHAAGGDDPRADRRVVGDAWPPAQIRVLGGAMARVPTDATAFAHRQSRMMINVAAIYDPSTSERSEHAGWVRGLSTELDDGDPGAYAGFLADEGEERVRAAYPGATWERLAAVKAHLRPRQRVPAQPERPTHGVDRRPASKRSGLASGIPQGLHRPRARGGCVYVAPQPVQLDGRISDPRSESATASVTPPHRRPTASTTIRGTLPTLTP